MRPLIYKVRITFEQGADWFIQTPYVDFLNRKTDSWDHKMWFGEAADSRVKKDKYSRYLKMMHEHTFIQYDLFCWNE